MREVLAAVGLRQCADEVALRQVAEQQHVEEAVVGRRVGTDLHPAAEVAAVGDDHVVHRRLAPFSADLDGDAPGPPAREHGERGPRVGDLAAERLRRLVRSLGDGAAHPRARDVREPAHALAAGPRAVGDAAEVERARLPRERDRGGGGGLLRDPELAHEVDAGAAREDGEIDVGPPGDPLHRLVDRAVAADDDEQRGAAVRRVARQLGQVPAPLREERVAGQPRLGELVRQLGPAPTRRPVVRGRIDQKDGAVANRWRRRARRASSGRPPRAARRRRSA